jgi:AcrR family transcriptional regulator
MSEGGAEPADRAPLGRTPGDRALDAFLRLIADKGFAAVALRDVAQEAGLGFAELYGLHSDKVSLVAAFMARIDAEVLAGTPSVIDAEETARDRLFDVMMRRYDSLKPHREAMRALRIAALRDPRCWRSGDGPGGAPLDGGDAGGGVGSPATDLRRCAAAERVAGHPPGRVAGVRSKTRRRISRRPWRRWTAA